ncbi:MAG: hypothetical protein AAF125_14310 [Chloroflexota bacterium]
MTTLSSLVTTISVISIPLLMLRAYLDLNKKWSRKHITEVADSISIGSHSVIMVTVTVFLLQSILQGQAGLVALYAISFVWNAVIIVIGLGVYVPANEGIGLGALLLRTLRLERAESTNLLRTFSNPKGTREILAVLRGLAAVDNRIDPQEVRLIQQFAEAWRVRPPSIMAGKVTKSQQTSLEQIREDVQAYLAVEPPAEQALQMLDLLQMFIEADDEIAPEEEIIMDEVNGLVRAYAAEMGTVTSVYEVRIVPQSNDQLAAVRETLPQLETTHMRGSIRAVIVGRFYSERYANIVSEKYRDLGLFTKAELLTEAKVA